VGLFPCLSELAPSEMRDESFFCEEKDPVSVLVNPDRIMGFFSRVLD
jgi:hypothetical protein